MRREILHRWEKGSEGRGKVIQLDGFKDGAGIREMTRCEVLRLTPGLEDNVSSRQPKLAVCFYSSEGQFTTAVENYAEVLKSVFGFQLE